MKLYRIIIAGISALFLGYVVSVFIMAQMESGQLIADFKTYNTNSTIDIYDRNDKLMFSFNKKNQIIIDDIEKFNTTLQTSVVAVEDHTFFEHQGVSYKGLIRTFKDYIFYKKASGGSTITMQVVRGLTNNREKTITRKLKEVFLAWELENHYSKQEILNRYFNDVYMGNNIYGFEAASKYYFGKTNFDLHPRESIFLVGMLNAPQTYVSDNIEARRRSLRRRDYVLKRVENYSSSYYLYLRLRDVDQYQPIDLQQNAIKSQSPNSYALEEVRKYLYDNYTTYELQKGMKVYTTFDSEIQKSGELALQNNLYKYDDKVQGSLIAMNQTTGEIYAVVGGRNFSDSEFNRAFQAKRQPGSAFKPFVYGAAFEDGKIDPLTIVKDIPLKVRIGKQYYTPLNNDRDFWGPVTVWEALVNSRNIPAVSLNMKIGPSRTAEYANKAGFESTIPVYPSSALGTGTVTLKEITRAYGTIANLGMRTPTPFFIKRIENRKNEVLQQHEDEKTVQVFNPDHTYELSETLRGVIEKGTGKKAKTDFPTAGKTGTTDNRTDAWFIGYSYYMTCGVWVGRDDNKKISDTAEGGNLAAPIFSDFMTTTHKNLKKQELLLPINSQRKNFAPPDELENEIFLKRYDLKKKLKKAEPEVLIWQ